MSGQSADVIVRLLAKDEGLREALKGAGKDGEKALKQIDNASKKAGPGLKAVDNVAIDLKQSLSNALDGLGPFGSALKGLGPVGIAAGAAIAGITAGAVAAANAGDAAARALAQIGIDADKVGLSTDALQALRFALSGVIQNENELTSALQAANKTTGEAAAGTGELFSVLSTYNPEVLKAVQGADSLKDRLGAVRLAYNQASSEVERSQILLKTFGDSGVAAGKAMIELEGGIDGAIDSARQLGGILGADLIAAGEAATKEIEQANKRIEASMTRLKVRFVGVSVEMRSAWANLVNIVAGDAGKTDLEAEFDKMIDRIARGKKVNKERFEEVQALRREEIALSQLAADMDAEAQAKIDKANKAGAALQAAYNRLIKESVTATEQRAAGLEELDQIRAQGLIKDDAEYERLRAAIVEKYKDVEAIRAQEKAARDYEKAAQDAARARAKGIDLLSQSANAADAAGAITQRVAAYQAELTDNMDAYGLTVAQVSRLVIQYRENLDGTTKAKDTLNSAMQGLLDPVARFKAETQSLQTAQNLANIDHDKFNALMERRKVLLGELERAQADAAQTDQFGETLEAAEARIKNSLKTASEIINEKVELQRKIIEALGDKLSDDQATAFLEKYRKDLEKTKDKTDELTAAQSGLIDIVKASSSGWDSLGQTALRVLQDMIVKSLEANNTLGSGGIGGFFGNLATSFFGGGGSAAVSVPVNHSGKAVVGAAGGARRMVDPAVFLHAPRFHSGAASIGNDEVPMIAQKGERIFSRSDNSALIAAINGSAATPAASGVQVIIKNYGSDNVQTEERQGADGQKELIATIGKQMKNTALQALSSREGKNVMQSTYGLKPRVGSR